MEILEGPIASMPLRFTQRTRDGRQTGDKIDRSGARALTASLLSGWPRSREPLISLLLPLQCIYRIPGITKSMLAIPCGSLATHEPLPSPIRDNLTALGLSSTVRTSTGGRWRDREIWLLRSQVSSTAAAKKSDHSFGKFTRKFAGRGL